MRRRDGLQAALRQPLCCAASRTPLKETQPSYGNEKAVEQAIRHSALARGDLFITSKLWVSDTGYDKTKRAFEASMKRLGLDVLDLYLIHQPYGDIYGSWRAMQDFYREGRIRAIGVSNFAPDRIMDFLMNSEIKPAVNQIETHPFHQQDKANALLKKHGVHHESWGPFAEGKNDIFRNERLVSISNKHQKTVAQVILRWIIERGITAIPKSVKKERIVENFQVFDFKLDASDLATIAPLDSKVSSFFDHRDPKMVEWLCARKLSE